MTVERVKHRAPQTNYQKPRSRSDQRRRYTLRAFADMAMALIVFSALSAPSISAPLAANPYMKVMADAQLSHQIAPIPVPAVTDSADPPSTVEIATVSSPRSSLAAFRRTSQDAAKALFGLALSVLVALNLALIRHLKQTYAPSRRRRVRA